jgi:hypothetical protein
MGEIIGGHILDLLDAPAEEIVATTVQVDRTILRFPVRSRADVSPPRIGQGDCQGRLTSSIQEGHRSLQALRDTELPPVLDLPISVVTVGSRRWLHLPVEMCATYGREIALGYENVRVVGYSDAYLGYIADRDSFRSNQYEAQSSYFDEETSLRVMVECRDYLGSVYETSRSYRSPR